MADDIQLRIKVGQATNIATSLICAQKGSAVTLADLTPALVREVLKTLVNIEKEVYAEELTTKDVKKHLTTELKGVITLEGLLQFRNDNLKEISSLKGEDKIKFEEYLNKISKTLA